MTKDFAAAWIQAQLVVGFKAALGAGEGRGGAIFNYNGSIQIEDVEFAANAADVAANLEVLADGVDSDVDLADLTLTDYLPTGMNAGVVRITSTNTVNPLPVGPWINDLEFMKLETEPLRSKWRAWLLDPAPVPEDSRALAGQIATMIVFDALSGNWDRWSGANVGLRPKTRELVFVDNDGAFMVPTPAPFERQRDLLKGLKKYPRGLVHKLRALDAAGLRAALGEERPGAPLLSPAALDQLEARRRDVVSEADARVRELGEAKVFVFE
jgi:hypothetical protein